jgi:NADPH-ferrihemoprotein reductase
MWPELDQLLRDDHDTTGASTPYTAAIPEYRVVFIDKSDLSFEERSWTLANGTGVIDAQHLCRYLSVLNYVASIFFLSIGN